MTDSRTGPGHAPSRLKIAHLVSSLARGGGERLMIDLANDQLRRGHDVRVIAGKAVSDGKAHAGLDPRIPVTTIAPERSSRPRHYSAMLRWFAENAASLDEMDVVHCHMTSGAVLGTLVQLRRGGKSRPAVVETYHAVGMPIPPAIGLAHRWMLKRRDAVAFMVDYPLRRLLEATAKVPTAVIPAAVESIERPCAAGRSAGRRSMGIPDSATFVVGTIGRFVPERRPWVYIPVFERIASALGPDVHFLMGGDGPELERVKGEAAAAGLAGRIHFPGLITDLYPALAAIDVYVTVNVGPVPGVAGLQAITAGLPTVAYQIVDDYPGGEFDPLWSSRDGGRIAQKIIDLLRSAENRAKFAAAQGEHVRKNHSPVEMAEAYVQLYDVAMKHAARRASR